MISFTVYRERIEIPLPHLTISIRSRYFISFAVRCNFPEFFRYNSKIMPMKWSFYCGPLHIARLKTREEIEEDWKE